jgi:hypothetical protein
LVFKFATPPNSSFLISIMSRKVKRTSKPMEEEEYSNNNDEINKKIKKKTSKIIKVIDPSPPRKAFTVKKSQGPKIRTPKSYYKNSRPFLPRKSDTYLPPRFDSSNS